MKKKRSMRSQAAILRLEATPESTHRPDYNFRLSAGPLEKQLLKTLIRFLAWPPVACLLCRSTQTTVLFWLLCRRYWQ